jgi:hypothetical protein
VPTIDSCEHWKDYRIPTDAAVCPGCGRRHPVHVPPPAPRVAAVVAAALGLEAPPAPPSDAPRAAPTGRTSRRRPGPLLRSARVARWLLALTAWAATAFALASAASYVVGLDDLADDLSDDVPGRVADVAHAIGLGAAAAFALAMAGTITWSRLAHRNLAALQVTPTWRSAWSLGGWLVPGRRAKAHKVTVDAMWRDSSPALASLSHRGWTRRPVSRVVLHWWTLWLVVPAAGLVAGALAGGADELHDERALVGVAGAALAVAAARALYDVVGLVTVAQAHRAEAVIQERAIDPITWSADDDGWADAPVGDLQPADDLEPLRG